QLTGWSVNKISVGNVAGAELHLLAECARVYCLMTSDAANIVVRWSKSFFDGFFFLENELIVFEPSVTSGARRNSFRSAFVYRRAERAEVVEKIVGLCVHVSCKSLSRGKDRHVATSGFGIHLEAILLVLTGVLTGSRR